MLGPNYIRAPVAFSTHFKEPQDKKIVDSEPREATVKINTC